MTNEKVAYYKMCQKNRLFVLTDRKDWCCGTCRFTINKVKIEEVK